MYEPLDAAAQQQGVDRGGVENAGVDDAEHRVRGAREPSGDGNAGRGSALLITPRHTDLVTSSAGLAAEDEDHRDVKQQAAQEREAKSSVGQQQLPEEEDGKEQSEEETTEPASHLQVLGPSRWWRSMRLSPAGPAFMRSLLHQLLRGLEALQ
ncbi:hypothetical protein HaLaN_23814, partial [Haematococcus lacustris]